MSRISIKGILDSVLSLGIGACTSSLELLSGLKKYPGSTNMPVAEKVHSMGVFIPCFSRMLK